MKSVINPLALPLAHHLQTLEPFYKQIRQSHLQENLHFLLKGPMWEIREDGKLYKLGSKEETKTITQKHDLGAVYTGFEKDYMALQENCRALLKSSSSPQIGWISRDCNRLLFKSDNIVELEKLSYHHAAKLVGKATAEEVEKYIEAKRSLEKEIVER